MFRKFLAKLREVQIHRKLNEILCSCFTITDRRTEYIYIYSCAYMYVFMYVSIYVRTYVYTNVCMYEYMYVCVCVFMNIWMYVCVYL